MQGGKKEVKGGPSASCSYHPADFVESLWCNGKQIGTTGHPSMLQNGHPLKPPQASSWYLNSPPSNCLPCGMRTVCPSPHSRAHMRRGGGAWGVAWACGWWRPGTAAHAARTRCDLQGHTCEDKQGGSGLQESVSGCQTSCCWRCMTALCWARYPTGYITGSQSSKRRELLASRYVGRLTTTDR
jgi:hypothetical protein